MITMLKRYANIQNTNLLDFVQQLGQLKSVASGGIQLKVFIHCDYLHANLSH